jgi:hypothetical protein
VVSCDNNGTLLFFHRIHYPPEDHVNGLACLGNEGTGKKRDV